MLQYDLNALQQPVGKPVNDWVPPIFPAHETLNGRFCRVEPLNVELHTDSLYQANALDHEGSNWTYLPNGPFGSIESYREWVAEASMSVDPQYYAIIDVQSGRAVGVAAYLRIVPASGSIEVGWLNFSPLLQQTAAATEAMYLMMQHVFALGYRRYEWKCNALNAPSRAAAQRLGFSYEGLFRQAIVVKGRNRDTAWYSVIDGEWPLLKQSFERWLAAENFDAAGRQRISLSSLTSSLVKQKG
jgi:RimJ/RimL family protein N-acetyltransferase